MGSQNLQIANNDLEILQCPLYSSKDIQEDILLPPHLSQSTSQLMVKNLQHIHVPFLFTYPLSHNYKPLYIFRNTYAWGSNLRRQTALFIGCNSTAFGMLFELRSLGMSMTLPRLVNHLVLHTQPYENNLIEY